LSLGPEAWAPLHPVIHFAANGVLGIPSSPVLFAAFPPTGMTMDAKLSGLSNWRTEKSERVEKENGDRY
jgi:hypothetical protein